APIGLDSSFSGTIARDQGEWSGMMGFGLDVRNKTSTVPQVGVGFTVQTTCSAQENAPDESNGTFDDIAEYEESEDVSATAQHTDGKFNFDRVLVVLRAAFDSFSCRVSADMPLKHSDSDALRVQIRASTKMPHFFVEASGTGNFEMEEKRFSIASARLYVKIPL
ncbi:MAG: hypothetical protein ABFC92_06575, partial [Rectinema sp.]